MGIILSLLDSGVGGGTDGRNSDRLRLYVNGESTPLSFGTYSGWGTLITGNIRDLNNQGQTHQINTRLDRTTKIHLIFVSTIILMDYNLDLNTLVLLTHLQEHGDLRSLLQRELLTIMVLFGVVVLL